VTIDTRSMAITSCNDAFAEVLGRTADDVQGCPITDFIDDDAMVATAVLEGIRGGFITSVDGNVDLLREVGSVGVDYWILALGTERPLHRAMAGVVPADAKASSSEVDPSDLGFQPAPFDPGRIVLATLDDDWRIIEVAPGSAGQLRLPVPGAKAVMPQLHELTHPADTSTLDGSFGRRSSTGTPVTFTARLRGAREQWLSARLTVSPLRGHLPGKFGLVVWLMPAEEPAATESERVARLEDQLARIRHVVQATGGDTATPFVELDDLTVRQREIVERLLEGHRVDAIARDLYVSPSTVRNHLSAIFEKLGVASQSELIELIREPGGP
jgi:DNA-binding CsgD family transcriptional regulator